MTRTRWIFAALALSLALNVFLAAALWRSRAARTPPPSPPAPAPCSAEEMALREQLGALLCAEPPDCTAIEAAFTRIDALRAKERQAALDQWVSAGRRVGCQNNKMSPEVERLLCPWKIPAGGS